MNSLGRHQTHRTLLDVYESAAASAAGVTIAGEREDDVDEFRSYAEILQAARVFAGGLVRLGLRPGDRVLLVLPTGQDFLAAFAGCQLAGVIPVPNYPPPALQRTEISVERLSGIAANCGARLLVTIRTLLPLLGGVALRARSLERLVGVEELRVGEPLLECAKVEPDQTAFLQYTSGSTSSPKGVVISHRAVVANVTSITDAVDPVDGDKLAHWLPLYHDMGLVSLLWAWSLGVSAYLLSPLSFILRPVRWLRAFSTERATISTAPSMGYSLCLSRIRDQDLEGLDLSSWRLSINGAEPVDVATAREFQRKYAPWGLRKEVMMPCYGLAETTLAATFSRHDQEFTWERISRRSIHQGRAELALGGVDDADAVELPSLGPPVLGNEVRIIGEQGELFDEGRIGEIHLRGPGLMDGYYANPQVTAATLVGGWFKTGDLGYLRRGELYITGRLKNLLIVRGNKVHAEDLEVLVEALDGIKRGGCVVFAVPAPGATDDHPVVICETALTDDDARAVLVDAIGAVVNEVAGVPPEEVVLVAKGTIPKTPSGKRQRDKTRELYQNGGLRPQTTGKLGLVRIGAESLAGHITSRFRRLKK